MTSMDPKSNNYEPAEKNMCNHNYTHVLLFLLSLL